MYNNNMNQTSLELINSIKLLAENNSKINTHTHTHTHTHTQTNKRKEKR